MEHAERLPLPKLLEYYVMWSAGQLRKEHLALMEKMTPSLQETYNREGAWQDILAAVMGFGPQLPAQIKQIWERNIAKGAALSAEQFARMFVDQNFIHKKP